MTHTSAAVVLATAIVLTAGGCERAPRTDLTKVRGLVVYQANGEKAASYSVDAILRMAYCQCDPQIVRRIFPSATYSSDAPMWKGSRLGILSFDDGTTKRIEISYYGGFFGVVGEKGTYDFPKATRDEWDRLIQGPFQEPDASRTK